ncbi:hypothetical protein PORCRE_2121 [Porphyromonas crevioricanis JCM 15906]|uniref:Glycosyltransferase RgtA/B/C/D-like domain-containing protein n=2 Tax=Porphyromonas crevioricanis TaxID=393921 RepID=T1CT39_9PORP|nr:hypothetical protein PORCRE_2121 [Porphyromonas crevioricanis JCM 15906]
MRNCKTLMNMSEIKTSCHEARQVFLGFLSSLQSLNKERLQAWGNRHKAELLFFAIVWLGYLSLALLAYQLQLPTVLEDLEKDDFLPGAMLGYDNFYFFFRKGGVQDFVHPFVGPWHWLFGIVGLAIVPVRLNFLFQISLMATLVAAGVALLFAYAYRLKKLPLVSSIAVAAVTGTSFTALGLSFTCEYYPFSFFVLILSLYLLERDRQLYGYYRLRTVWASSFIAGGITLSNVAKPTLALLIQKPYKRGFKRACVLALCFTLLFLLSIVFFQLAYWMRHGEMQWIDLRNVSSWMLPSSQSHIEAFLAHPLFISDLSLQDFNGEITWRPDPYCSENYLFVLGPLLAVCLLGIWRGRREKALHLILCYIAVDLTIHLLLNYGMREAIIYGGHWVFVPALLAAYAYPRKAQNRMRYVLDCVLLFVAMAMLWHNMDVLFDTVLNSALLPYS